MNREQRFAAIERRYYMSDERPSYRDVVEDEDLMRDLARDARLREDLGLDR